MSLLFKDRHVGLIRDGWKTVTRRQWSENYGRPKVGNVYMAKTEFFEKREECDCWVRIVDVYEQELGDMTDEDAHAEGGYNLEEFKKQWEEINDEWDPDETVVVVELEYVGETHPDDQPERLKAGEW